MSRVLESSAGRAVESVAARGLEGVFVASESDCTDVLMEPFDNLSAWTTSGTPSGIAGRNGGGVNCGGTSGGVRYALLTPSDTLTVGFAYRRNDSATGLRDIFQLYSGTATTLESKLTYNFSTTTLAFTRSSTAIASSAAVTFTQLVWYYIEVQAKLHDSTGYVIVRVNGVEVINATGLNTSVASAVTYDQLRLQCTVSGSGNDYDDLYLSTGTECEFKGDITVPSPPGTDVLMEPFDNFTDAPWTNLSAATIVAGRTGTAAQIGSSGSAYFSLGAAESEYVTVGFAWKVPSVGAIRYISALRSDTGGTTHLTFVTNASNIIEVRRGSSTGSVLGQCIGFTLAANTWYYIEYQARLGSSTGGSVIIRIDGIEALNVTAVNTRNGGTKTVFDTPSIGSQASINSLFDDLYVSVGAGATFKGDITI